MCSCSSALMLPSSLAMLGKTVCNVSLQRQAVISTTFTGIVDIDAVSSSAFDQAICGVEVGMAYRPCRNRHHSDKGDGSVVSITLNGMSRLKCLTLPKMTSSNLFLRTSTNRPYRLRRLPNTSMVVTDLSSAMHFHQDIFSCCC